MADEDRIRLNRLIEEIAGRYTEAGLILARALDQEHDRVSEIICKYGGVDIGDVPQRSPSHFLRIEDRNGNSMCFAGY